MASHHTRPESQVLAYLGWGLISLFFMYQYVLRVTPGIVTHELKQAFSMTAEEFAALGAVYLYAYALLQIPLGFVLDRLGVKTVVLFSIFTCIVGTVALAQSQTVNIAILARFCIGAGSACAFMAAVKWVADYFPEGSRGFLMGTTLTLGVLGALGAGTFFVKLVEAITWRPAIMMTAWLGCALLMLVMICMKSCVPTVNTRIQIKDIFQQIYAVLMNKNILIYAALATGLYTPLAVLADLWGVGFLSQKFGMMRAQAASTVMYLYVGLALGCLVLPVFAEKSKNSIRIIQVSLISIFMLFCLIMLIDIRSPLILKMLLAILGFFAGAEMICFTGAVLHSTQGQTGLTVGVVNTINMLTGAVLDQMIGAILDWRWNGVLDQDYVRIYSTHDYIWAMSLLVWMVFVCVGLSFLLKENPCRHRS